MVHTPAWYNTAFCTEDGRTQTFMRPANTPDTRKQHPPCSLRYRSRFHAPVVERSRETLHTTPGSLYPIYLLRGSPKSTNIYLIGSQARYFERGGRASYPYLEEARKSHQQHLVRMCTRLKTHVSARLHIVCLYICMYFRVVPTRFARNTKTYTKAKSKKVQWCLTDFQH